MARLDRDQIAAAALAVIDKKGVEGFTIRAIADALGVTPMALYYHVKDKSDLARLVVSAANRDKPTPVPTGVWRDDMLAMAHWTRDVIAGHPALGEIHRLYPVYTPEMVAAAKRWLELWQQSGLDRKAAVRAAEISSIAIASLVIYVSNFDQADRTKRRPVIRTSRGPAAFLRQPDDLYELIFSLVIDGLLTKLSTKGRKRPRPRKSRRTTR